MDPARLATIAVGIDGSPGSACALRWATEEADLHGAVLTAVMAWGFLDQHPTGEAFDPTYDGDAAITALRTFLADTVGEERAAQIGAIAVCDLPARALVEAGIDADLLVIGARGLGGFKGLLLGSVSHHCLHHATVPVAVISHDADMSSAEGIVVAVDGSTAADRALAWALEEARRRKAPVTVVHAWHLSTLGSGRLATAKLDVAALERAARTIVAAAVERADTDGLDDVRYVVHRGSPASAVLATSRNAELIVVGTQGRGRLKRILLGPVAAQVSQHAAAPVIVIPPAS